MSKYAYVENFQFLKNHFHEKFREIEFTEKIYTFMFFAFFSDIDKIQIESKR